MTKIPIFVLSLILAAAIAGYFVYSAAGQSASVAPVHHIAAHWTPAQTTGSIPPQAALAIAGILLALCAWLKCHDAQRRTHHRRY